MAAAGVQGSAGIGRGSVVLAADHRARGMITIERYPDYLAALRAALPACDGVLASAQPLADLVAGGVQSGQRTYLSINRTGLAGAAFELDDRLVASVESAAACGYSGVKLLTRIDLSNPHTAAGLELLGRVLEDSRRHGLEALIEPLSWRDGAVDRSVDGIVYAAVVAHDLGAPLLKVPVPAAPAGPARIDSVCRVVESVGVPVLFLGGPRTATRADVLNELADAMRGGAAGVAIGRTIITDPQPGVMAGLVADLVRGRRPLDAVLEASLESGREVAQVAAPTIEAS
jgi:DhnA family fructose-bisphosphate aldolase class Ia